MTHLAESAESAPNKQQTHTAHTRFADSTTLPTALHLCLSAQITHTQQQTLGCLSRYLPFQVNIRRQQQIDILMMMMSRRRRRPSLHWKKKTTNEEEEATNERTFCTGNKSTKSTHTQCKHKFTQQQRVMQMNSHLMTSN